MARTSEQAAEGQPPIALKWRTTFSRARQLCLGLIIAILIWAPFPLGSNREWSWSILTLLLAICWLSWAVWAQTDLRSHLKNAKRIWFPLLMVAFTLLWVVIQTLSIVPEHWIHPAWPAAADLMHRHVAGSISINRWRTTAELIKLATYIGFSWLLFSLARSPEYAKTLLNVIVITGAGYAVYAFVIGIFGFQQYRLFYMTTPPDFYISGPFVQRDSFATYEGLASVAAVARLIELASEKIVISKGAKRGVLSTIRFLTSSGATFLVGTVLMISAIVASASRGGFLSTFLSLGVMIVIFAMRFKRGDRTWVLVGASALLILLALISGQALVLRTVAAVGSDADSTRKILWMTTLRMIESAPLLGLGLGTFQDAYPMYASNVLPYIMDKAHSDILEFVAGVGIPAAACWWAAFLAISIRMCRGFFERRRDKIYPLMGFCSTILIVANSAIDFSFQIPAIAFSYAALVGVGLAQSYSTR